jgi:phospho-N-acetylmuramoyl-pentapeptide-transferase
MEINITFLLVIFLVNLALSPFIIYFLNKFGFYKKKETTKEIESQRNKSYYSHLLSNMSTPSSFGILLILNLIGSLFIFNTSNEFLYVVLASVILGLLGFADDIYQFFYYRTVGQWGFKARYKMAVQLIVLFSLFFLLSDSFLYSIVTSILGTFILNSFNITDGLDGLAGGLAMPSFLLFAYLEYTNNGISNILFLILLLIIFLFVFMIFNFKPAKVFLGDSGSYAIGAIMAFLVFRYNLIYTLPVISLFLIEGVSSMLQILSIKLFKKKIFKIAPLHLHLLNSGWSQWKVISIAWSVQIIVTIITFILINNVR